jgi:DNA-3-methyladenine glycosylase
VLDPDEARALLAGPTLQAAARLLGAHLIREPTAGGEPAERRVVRIVEVEAYVGPDDQASHARFGRTRRTDVMFGPPGRAYVYLVYGMYHCLNVVTEPEGQAGAVLIRAAEPVEGLESLQAARRAYRASPESHGKARPQQAGRVASGPGGLCAAMSIDRSDTGLDLLDAAGRLRLELPATPLAATRIGTSARIGIGYAPEPWQSAPWRFFDRDSPAVSGPMGVRSHRSRAPLPRSSAGA